MTIYASTNYAEPGEPLFLVVTLYDTNTDNANLSLQAVYGHHKSRAKGRNFRLTLIPPQQEPHHDSTKLANHVPNLSAHPGF